MPVPFFYLRRFTVLRLPSFIEADTYRNYSEECRIAISTPINMIYFGIIGSTFVWRIIRIFNGYGIS